VERNLPRRLVLFVQSHRCFSSATPDYAPFVTRFAPFMAPRALWGYSKRETKAAGEETFELPADVAQCVRLVSSLAPKLGFSVEVVDLSQPGKPPDPNVAFVPRPEDCPVLLRPDGARLVGAEWFTPENLKRFLS
jgi:hypothetical protein